jgi:ribonuclease P protein component
VGGAVVRNRVKRRLRACVAEVLPVLQPGWDVILIARKNSGQASFQEIRQAVLKLLQQSGTITDLAG